MRQLQLEAEEHRKQKKRQNVSGLHRWGPFHQPVPLRALPQLPELGRPPQRSFSLLSGSWVGRRGEGSTVAPCRVASEKQVPGVQALCCLRGGPSACAPGAQGERTTDEGQPGLLYLIQVRLGWLGRRGGLANISSELACVTCP